MSTEPEKNTPETEIKFSKEVSEVGEKIEKWNLGKISELIEWIKEKFNIQEQVAIQSTTTTQTEEKAKEKGKVSVQWIGMEKEGLSVIPIFGAIREAVKNLKGEDINIVRAKKLTEEGEKIILVDVPRDKAEEFQIEMKKKGAKVEIK